MDIIFFTNNSKLDDLGIEIEIKKSGEETVYQRCFKKNSCGHNIYRIFDGGARDVNLNDDYKDFILPFLSKIINDDHYIVRHSNQSKDFDTILDNVSNNRKFDGMHEPNHEGARYYEMLPTILADEEALQNLVDELQLKIDGTDELNLKLTFLHKLLGGQKGLEEEYKKYHDEYDGLPIFPSEINNEFIKKVRDIILDKVV